MSSYKLTYFKLAGLGEPIRFILSYAGVDFEDNRIGHDVWPQHKPHTPLEQLPILEVDGKTLYQSNAIIRYLARKFNLNGGNDFEAFQVDAALETIGDLRQLLAKWAWTSDAAQKSAAEAETLKKAAFFLSKFEAAVKQNGGFFVGGKLSVADIVFAGFSNFFAYLTGKDLLVDYPNLKGVVAKVLAEPKIKAYVDQRPETDF